METHELMQLVVEKLDSMEKSQEKFRNEMKSFRKESKESLQQLNKKLDLLTKQTSNAVVEHHANELKFLSSKVFELEKDLYKIKHS